MWRFFHPSAKGTMATYAVSLATAAVLALALLAPEQEHAPSASPFSLFVYRLAKSI
jgi:hypothetical protein